MKTNKTLIKMLGLILTSMVAIIALCSLSGCYSDQYVLPPQATNIHDLGGGWGQFNLQVNGKNHTFLYFHPDMKNEVKAITVVD